MKKSGSNPVTGAAPGFIRGVHLDLKYHMPNKAGLLNWVKRLPGYGVNALLLEYEDAFPYRRYPFLAGPDAFTPAELRAFLSAARKAGLTVIPLVQTYAHLEFALTHDALAPLRERPDIQTKICARKPEAVRFVNELLEEVLAYHQEDPYFHLGGDEVWHTGWCADCEERIRQVGPIRMWTDHMKPLLESIVARGKRPIVWDDIFWKDFELVGQVGLPRETILHAWNYNITSLTPKNADSADLDLGGAGGVLKQVDIYRKAGFASLAGPCYNFGQLFARHTHSIQNTRVWAQKMRAAGMLGMLNTAWAVFHIPLQMLDLYVAATGELCRNPDSELDFAWQERWFESEFGGPAKGVPEALDVLGAGWEIPAPAYERPFTPLVYGYMNMVFHYPGRHKDRQRLGAYPRDWSEIDFAAVYRKGLEEARRHPDPAALFKELDDRLAAFPPAVAALRRFADRAARRRDAAEMMADLAELKYLSLRLFAHQLRGDGSAADLRRDRNRLEAPVNRALAQAWEPIGRERMRRAFMEPMIELLKGEAERDETV
ncbi:MAG: family 20 glycosylhydrolase [Kiritimatiellia bacterium]